MTTRGWRCCAGRCGRGAGRHAKLLELADGLAADRAVLAGRVGAATAGELADRADVLDAFLAAGVTREGETRQAEADFWRVLRGWTAGAVGCHLTSTAGLLSAFLCRLEPDDRWQDVVAANWRDVLTRLGEGNAPGLWRPPWPSRSRECLDGAGGARSRRPGGRGAPGPRPGAAASACRRSGGGTGQRGGAARTI